MCLRVPPCASVCPYVLPSGAESKPPARCDQPLYVTVRIVCQRRRGKNGPAQPFEGACRGCLPLLLLWGGSTREGGATSAGIGVRQGYDRPRGRRGDGGAGSSAARGAQKAGVWWSGREG